MEETLSNLNLSSFRLHEWYSASSLQSSMMFTSTVLVLIVTGVLAFYSTIGSALLSLKMKTKGRPPLPPGSFGFPIVGELMSFLPDRTAFHIERHAKYGPVFKTNVFGKLVFIKPPAGNKFAFSNEGKLVEISWPKAYERLFGRHSVTVQVGDAHRLARRQLTPFLSQQALLQHVPRIESHIRRHLEKFWRPPPAETDDDCEGFELALHPFMNSLSFSVIADLLISLEPDETEELLSFFQTWLHGFGCLPIDIPGTGYRRALNARASARKIVLEMLSNRRAALEEGTASSTQDMMSHLLTVPDETGRLCPEEEILDQILFFLFAGRETVSTVFTFTLRFIALLPEVRQRVKDEMDAVARTKILSEGLTKEDLAQMNYSWRVIQETMRLMSVIDVGFRLTLKDIEYGGYTIPKGWKVAWTASSHMDPKIFKDPEVFDPERFNGSWNIPPYAYTPFGGGPHKCAGGEFAKIEMLMLLFTVIRDYQFDLVDPNEPILHFPNPYQKSGTLLRVRKLKGGGKGDH